MLVCIDKITCARMLMLIEPAWQAKAVTVRAEAEAKLGAITAAPDEDSRQQLHAQRDRLLAKAAWLEQTFVEIIISEAQNEVADFKKWGFDIIPHRARMKLGFETPDGKRLDVESAFKNPQHPFRVAVVCAMWLTGFDVECLSTLYIDKPMRAHTLMQAIARANRRYPGKDFGLITRTRWVPGSTAAGFLSMPRCVSKAPSGRGWNVCCATALARPSLWSIYNNSMPSISSTTAPSHAPRHRALWCSRRWSSSTGSPPWCPRRVRIATATTAFSPQMLPCGLL